MSPPEIALWSRLRLLRANGWHFRRQAPEGPYFLDFVCKKARLVIEVDGAHHSGAAQSQHDNERDAYLEGRGFTVLRIWASDISTDLDGVTSTILAALGNAQASIPEPNAPSKVGGRYGRLVRMGLRQRPLASD